MTTQKQIDANGANAKLSTGPKTAAGKEASAGNALTHGMTAQSERYLTNSESPEEFEAEYAQRRKLYPPNDPIIDKLVRKITLAHFRFDRANEAEAEMIGNADDSLAQVLVQYDRPIKHLTGYEASNRRTLKLLEEELARYVSMLREAGEITETEETNETDEPDPTSPKPKGPSPKKKKPAKSDTPAKPPAPLPTSNTTSKQPTPSGNGSVHAGNSAGTTMAENFGSAAPIPKPAVGENLQTKPISSGYGTPILKSETGEESKTEPISSGSAPPIPKAATGEILKTNPISTGGCDVAKAATETQKSEAPPVEGSPTPSSPETAVPIKEPCPEVATTTTTAPVVPSKAVPPAPPTPPPVPAAIVRPRLNHDINNWHVPRPLMRR